MAASREVYLSDLPPEFADQSPAPEAVDAWPQALQAWADRQLRQGKQALLDEAAPLFERSLIDVALKHSGGRRQDAARLLGWGRNTLTRKIKELDFDASSESGPDA